MAIVKKFDSDKIYISGRLEDRIGTILTSPLTIIEAPTGYGKTVVCKEFLKSKNVKYVWFNIDSSDKETFCNDFTKRLESVDIDCARKIRESGIPKNPDIATKIAKVLFDMDLREKTVLVIDNYHLISDDNFNHIVKDLTFGKNDNLKVVLLTQAITSSITFELVLKKKLNYIGKYDFELNEDEIKEYFKECGIKLNDNEASFLYKYTEGWISALFLQMLSYISTEKFEPTVSVDNLICNAIWNNLNRKEQDFLIAMSIFNNFTIGQANMVAGNYLAEDEIEELLKKNSFIKYDSKSRKYYIHSVLKYFLEMEFDKLELVFKKEIYDKAGKWFAANEEYFNGIKYFYLNGDTRSILDMKYCGDDLISKMTAKNKEIFIFVVNNATEQEKTEFFKNYLIFLYAMFGYNERDLLTSEYKQAEMRILEMKLSEMEKRNLHGEMLIIEAMLNYNDIEQMNECYKKAFAYLEAPSKIFGNLNLNFNNPSVLMQFHSKNGELTDEVDCFHEMMPVYYKLFNGSSKGSEALFKAEMMMYQANFKDALKLSEKAVYMATTRDTQSIVISATFLETRIAYFNGEYDKVNAKIESIKKIAEESENVNLQIVVDLAVGYISTLIDSEKSIPGWLKDNNSIERRCDVYNLGFANLVYGRYLLMTEKYDEFLAVSGQMLSLAEKFNNILYKIYIYIYMVQANLKQPGFSEDKVVDIMNKAIELAESDNIYIPFIENIEGMESIITKMTNSEHKDFVAKIMELVKKYSRNISASKKASKSDQSFGLTNRELEVAKLAAKRMSNKEIADMLFIAESTVKSNMKVIFNKLSINSRNELQSYFDN